jgi:hypothetical protein
VIILKNYLNLVASKMAVEQMFPTSGCVGKSLDNKGDATYQTAKESKWIYEKWKMDI